jgi:phosphoglucomutase
MLKPASKNIHVTQKTVSVSCDNCSKLTEIEGVRVCFENGKIIRLVEDTSATPLLKMYCHSWQKDQTKKSNK